jgi:hypothetical protein
MIFSVTYSLELKIPFFIDVVFYQVKMLMFYSVQTTNSTMIGKNEMHSR